MNASRALALLSALSLTVSVSAQTTPQRPPVPRPFPGAPLPGTALPQLPPEEATLGGAPVYPTAEFLESFDAGKGQRYYLYGSNTDYETVVNYYRNVMRNGGRELFKEPAMQQFDLGRYDDNRMAFPPSIVVKDYGSDSAGYLFVDGTTQKRFLTIIQIVPLTAGGGG